MAVAANYAHLHLLDSVSVLAISGMRQLEVHALRLTIALSTTEDARRTVTTMDLVSIIAPVSVAMLLTLICKAAM